jgi:hypothetical protein
MIDPRILQQHFQRVQKREMPPKPEIPRVPDLKPLTAIQAIPVPEPVIEQKVELPPVSKLEVEKKEPIDLIIDAPAPIDSLIIDEIEDIEEVIELKEEKEVTTEDPTPYDPYGYYSGAKF